MRVKISASVDVAEALEVAVQSSPSASLEAPLKRREASELQFGLKEAADVIVAVKDFAELVALCWAGLQVLRGASAKVGPAEASHTRSTDPPGQIALEISTATAQARIAMTLDSTREQIREQLASLMPGGRV